MAAPFPGPFGQDNTSFTDPLSVALGQRESMLLEAEQSAQSGQGGALAQAIAGLQQANQADTAPTTDLPFPQGGLKGALFGFLAGYGGLGPQLLRQESVAKAQNLQQEGYLKLRQAERDSKIAGLQMKEAELDADYTRFKAQLEATTDLEQQKLLAGKMEQIRKEKDAREKWLTRDGREIWRSLQMPLVASMTTGQFNGMDLGNDEHWEAAQASIELALAELPPELRGEKMALAMSFLKAGRDKAIRMRPVVEEDGGFKMPGSWDEFVDAASSGEYGSIPGGISKGIPYIGDVADVALGLGVGAETDIGGSLREPIADKIGIPDELMSVLGSFLPEDMMSASPADLTGGLLGSLGEAYYTTDLTDLVPTKQLDIGGVPIGKGLQLPVPRRLADVGATSLETIGIAGAEQMLERDMARFVNSVNEVDGKGLMTEEFYLNPNNEQRLKRLKKSMTKLEKRLAESGIEPSAWFRENLSPRMYRILRVP